ncbi:MAG: metallophosphoesterase [Candidatus Aenigmarchaeota archaeon]|nr:metallophosphoesterase [Candidatus Aenigmarchaeota archaeon]
MAMRKAPVVQKQEIKFVTGQPAVLVNDTLVIADLHIGVEYGYYKSGIRIPSNTPGLLKAIKELIGLTGARNLIMLGDVKHKVPGSTKQELREIPEFLSELGRKTSIDIATGNHDTDLKNFLPENVRLHPSAGFAKDGFFFLHGHAWPDEKFLKADYVFVGHEHPQIEFRDKLGHRFYEQVWIRAELDRVKLAKKYKNLPSKLPELIMVPKFNRLSGGISMNYSMPEIEREHKNEQSGIGVLVRSARLRTAKVYMLDGTFLGELKDLF